jgi:hypothetical protein
MEKANEQLEATKGCKTKDRDDFPAENKQTKQAV